MRKQRKTRYSSTPVYYIHLKKGSAAGIEAEGVLVTCKPIFDNPAPLFTVSEMNTPKIKHTLKQKLDIHGDFEFISLSEYLVRKIMGRYTHTTKVEVEVK